MFRYNYLSFHRFFFKLTEFYHFKNDGLCFCVKSKHSACFFEKFMVAKTLSAMLKRYGSKRQICLASDLSGKAFFLKH